MGLLSRLQDELDNENGQPLNHLATPPTEDYIVDQGSATQQERTREVKKVVQRRMIQEMEPLLKKSPRKEREAAKTADKKDEAKPATRLKSKKTEEDMHVMRERMYDLFNSILQEERIMLTRPERQRMFEQVVADVLGFGPLEPLLHDNDISDIMVVGAQKVFIEKRGRLHETNVAFDDEEHLRHIIDRILAPLGRRVDETSPMVDARLPDGSRINAVIVPIALDGSCLTVRKFAAVPYRAHDLINFGTASNEVFEFLHAAVSAGMNVIVSGGSSSGKTTMLNVLSSYVPEMERIVTIENAAELQLQQEHVVRLETRPANVEGEGEMGMRDLVINSLRMRPDRIIVGEVRGPEAIDLLQAMNTGHEGSMGTVHANSPVDAVARLETMGLMAGMDLPIKAIREQMAAAIDIIIHMARMRDGTRKVTAIAEIEGMEHDTLMMSTIFEFEQTGRQADGEILGFIRPTGLVPRCLDKIEDEGFRLPPQLFGVQDFHTQRRSRHKTFEVEATDDSSLTEEELRKKYSYVGSEGKRPTGRSSGGGSFLTP